MDLLAARTCKEIEVHAMSSSLLDLSCAIPKNPNRIRNSSMRPFTRIVDRQSLRALGDTRFITYRLL